MSEQYNKYEPSVNRLTEATNAGLALMLINQPGGAVPDVVQNSHEYREPIQIAQAGDFDALKLLTGDRRVRQMAMDTNSPHTVKDFGSIQSMEVPKAYGRMRVPADTGYINMDEAPKLFQQQGAPDSKIGVWNRDLNNPQTFANLKEIFGKPAHALTDDEYFKISDIMNPGPWSGNGRGHEISMSSTKVNGKDAIVYDYWMGKDPAKDTPMSKLGSDDIRCRVVFVPNERTNKVDVLWMRAPNNEFDQKAREFDNSLRSIRWK
ncbi:MAG: hypothetical protein IT342_18400 [Candidatus Melainabacteria bacterium]|nr:hypothetical protein [Candidatus Melainabacteria bacterium]